MENYCKPATFICVGEFFTKFARALLLQIFLDRNQSLSFDSYKKGLEKAWLWKLVAIQFKLASGNRKIKSAWIKVGLQLFFIQKNILHTFSKMLSLDTFMLVCMHKFENQSNLTLLCWGFMCCAAPHVVFINKLNWINLTRKET